jgi:hypothetical protein
METLIECPQCGSTTVKSNSAKSVCCFNCKLYTTRSGRVERSVLHPDFDRLGYKIKFALEVNAAIKRGLGETEGAGG